MGKPWFWPNWLQVATPFKSENPKAILSWLVQRTCNMTSNWPQWPWPHICRHGNAADVACTLPVSLFGSRCLHRLPVSCNRKSATMFVNLPPDHLEIVGVRPHLTCEVDWAWKRLFTSLTNVVQYQQLQYHHQQNRSYYILRVCLPRPKRSNMKEIVKFSFHRTPPTRRNGEREREREREREQ